MIFVIGAHFAIALVVLLARPVFGRRAFLAGAIGPALVLAWAIRHAGAILDGVPETETVRWVPTLDLEIVLRIDAYALLFLFVIGVAGVAIFLYAFRYFGDGTGSAMFAATMTAFAGAMVGLVTSDHLLSIFLFWELTTVTSYLLIGYADHSAQARAAATQAALITGAGGLAMLAGLVLIADGSGTWLISEIEGGAAVPAIAWLLVLLGATTKSAQFPFHGWLPGAMAAPTPASAFLHSATMVKAGIFLVGRLGGIAADAVSWWTPVVIAIGFITMTIGGWQALRQHDLKRLLAFGTVSQLGFMFLLIGAGNEELLYGGLGLLLAHALFKATLFMVVGTIDHEAGTRDVRRLDDLRATMPVVFWTAVAASASMAALPLTFGFAAKEVAFEGLVHESTMLVAAAAVASILTVAYTGRFLIGAFGPAERGAEPLESVPHTPRNALTWAPGALAAISLALGLVPLAANSLVDAAVTVVTGIDHAGKIVIWHGITPALGWSAVSLALGLIVLARKEWTNRVLDAVNGVAVRLPTAQTAFQRTVSGLLTFADRSVSTIQSGSLPAYLGIIASVVVVAPTVAVFTGAVDTRMRVPVPGGGLEIVLGVFVIAAAVALPFVGRRFASMILLGGVGYGVAALYAAFGGPDLALTQVLVETLGLALFALVLRHLPATFTPPRTPRAPRILVAVAVGAFVLAGGLVMNSVVVDDPVSDSYISQSVPEAGGSNVVNVILVDFRGFDTLGEITVLVTAALGAASLVVPFVRRRQQETRP